MHGFEEHLRADETNSKREYPCQEGRMPAEEISSAEVERTTQEKGLRATIVRLLLIALFAGFCVLAYGYTTVHSDELATANLAAQVDSPESAQQPTATPQQPTVPPQDLSEQVQSLARDLDLLKVKVESELEAMGKTNDRNFYLFTFISAVGSLFGLATWYRGRQEHRDYEQEREFYEKRAQSYEDRREGEHEAILKLYGEQIKARQGENEYAGGMFALQEANLRQVNNITTAIAAGARENVDSLNTILSTFQRIMDFKVAEAKDARDLMERMKSQLAELEKAQRQQAEELLQNAVRLKRPRYIYTSPDPDLQRRMVEFRTQMDLMQRVILDRYTGVESPTENRRYGEIYLRRGIIAYYDNDMPKSREMLRVAEQFFPVPVSEQEIESMPLDEKLPIAFTQFYLALIEKNYHEMTAAKGHIEKSYAVYGQNEPEELLTPATRAEILSYLEDMDSARSAIREVLGRADNLRQRGPLKRHDAIYALRARLLLGNTYYVQGKWEEALQHYQDTLEADVRRDYSYYTYHSIAQVHHQLGGEEEAQENRRRAYKELVDTGHLRTKVALDTRILLNALAYLCTREDMPEKAKEYRETIQELWLRIREVNSLQLHLFSFEKKRPIGKDDFWTEVFGG
jgi:tetratricopeptide (TPR) repeat protein